MPQTRHLEHINLPADIKALPEDALPELCAEIRELLIKTVSENGGHLASNLGVVELTVALHRMFDSPVDQFVWDVGHQCYTHKLLTGRRDGFSELRREGGVSGFPRPAESEHDLFLTGHSSTAVSSAFGLAEAKNIQGKNGFVVAVVGDGALTGGLAYEALNNVGRTCDRLIVVINDNKMSISKNVGAMARHLAVMRSNPKYYKFKTAVERLVKAIPIIGKPLRNWLFYSKAVLRSAILRGNLFEDMGFAYLGPVDGHSFKRLVSAFTTAKKMERPVVVHVSTVKGKGYRPAEKSPKSYHGVSAFDIETGETQEARDSFSARFGQCLCALAQTDERICAVTAAMTAGCGLTEFRSRFKSRFFDVGIAEGHAVTFSGGLAKNGMIPVFAVYSSFLQRGFDQILHDAALQDLKMVLAIDRAGVVGEDGEAHQGLFDAAFLSSIPKVTVFAPMTYAELEMMLAAAVYDVSSVAAVRYPRGAQPLPPAGYVSSAAPFSIFGGGHAPVLIVTYGRLFAQAALAREALKERELDCDILKLNRIWPLEKEAVLAALPYNRVFFFEEGIKSGGIAEHFAAALLETGFGGKYTIHAVENRFVPCMTVPRALSVLGLDAAAMCAAIEN
ncbi:MAG: 1-deoxy-D-xylulose-5-phosphate synthase [Oscillospiraceae bacterium]|jgi:1-deoxy-D-xylulose-5-phosphate synthase|nr:1-deoxy-D-xylulose-5-phosphate synthase [Oscillospiraceae bacterium]